MKQEHKEKLLLLVLSALILILFLNDRVLKYEFSNWITGKFSDFVGLLSLPIFLALIFPKIKKTIALLVGLGFIIWKLPISDSIIAGWNSIGLFKVSRTIDYSDYLALIMIPIAHWAINNIDLKRTRRFAQKSMSKASLGTFVILATVIFCSTSKTEPAYPPGDILIDYSYELEGMTSEDVIESLENKGFIVSTDSILYRKNKRVTNRIYYQINQLVINHLNKQDTLNKINFKVYNSKTSSSIHIINLSVSDSQNLQDWEVLKERTKSYKKLIKKHLLDKIKDRSE